MLTGTMIGFICVATLLAAAILLAWIDRKEKSKFLSRTALILFIASFIGGVAVVLSGAIRPREAGTPLTGKEMGGAPPPNAPMASIGQVNPQEIEALKEKIAKDPKDIPSRERLGHLYLQMQDFENVFRMAHEVLTINPNSTESRVHLGMVLFAMQKIDDALEQFDEALKTDPNNLEALLFKGIVQFQGKDDLKGAKATWDHFMEIAKPTDTGYNRVQMFLKTINEQLATTP